MPGSRYLHHILGGLIAKRHAAAAHAIIVNSAETGVVLACLKGASIIANRLAASALVVTLDGTEIDNGLMCLEASPSLPSAVLHQHH